MSPNCIQAVRAAAAAAGRTVSDAKLKAIEDGIDKKMRELARRDRTKWAGMSREQRVAEAAAEAIGDLHAQAALKELRAVQQVLRTDETNQRIEQQMRVVEGVTRSQGLARDMQNVSSRIDAGRNDAIGHLTELIDAVSSKDGTGVFRNLGMRMFDLDNPAMTADVVREVFVQANGHTGNKAAQAGAKAWLETIEAMRQRFNNAGGNVGKLGYGYLSQTHDAVRVLTAGADAWAQKVLPLLDREQYVRPDGSLMGDGELMRLLHAAHETITTGGANKTDPGTFKGMGARANSGSESRVLHFSDGDAWMQYMGDYGQGSLYDAMVGHIGGMARDTGLVENYGPNPEQQFRLQNDIAERADGAGTLANRAFGNTPQAYWDLLSGKAGMAENRVIGQVGQDLRNVETAAKLGGAVLTSFTDVANVALELHFNRLPYFDMLKNIGRQFDGDTHDFLQAHGVIGEALTSSLNRFTGDHMTHSLTGRVAGSVLKLSGLNAWTDGLRHAFSMTLMSGLTRMAKKDWGALDGWDRQLLERKGINESDWAVVRQATPAEHDGAKFLTADSVRATGAPNAQQIGDKILGLVIDEAQFGVLNPDLATRAIVTGGGSQRGTLSGELARSAAQFKSFPIAMYGRTIRRIFETPQGLEGAPLGYGASSKTGAVANRIAILAGLNVVLMTIGAGVLQTKALVQGKDPFDMTEGKFWMRALAQGGGLGYLGDLLFTDPTGGRSGTAERMAGSVLGPVAGSVAGLVGDLAVVNLWEAAKGKTTHAGAEALRWVNAHLPGVNIWYIRGVWEHYFLHYMQEMANPGYLARVRRQAMKDWGTGDWIDDERAPDWAHAVGD